MNLLNRRKPAATIDQHGAKCGRGGPRMAVAMVVLGSCLASAPALAETRSLKLYHLHTHEKAEIVYKRNGRYDKVGLEKINHLLRDWRRNEPTRMDPRLLDLVWQAYRQSGSSAYIQVVSGYRAPATNAMLRGRSRGVAKESQHMAGKAMDFYLPDVPLRKLRDIGLRMQGGGVGFYPTSGSPFVHMDVANVRHWPRINRTELAQVFPSGKTLHVPSDGRPLPGYEQALSAYQARKESGTPNIEPAGASGKRRTGGLLAALFGGGTDEADDMADVATAASATRAEAVNAPAMAAVDPPKIAVAAPQDVSRPPTPETIVTSLLPGRVPIPAFAERTAVVPAAAFAAVPLPRWRPDREPEKVLIASAPQQPDPPAAPIPDMRPAAKADRVIAGSDRPRLPVAAIPAEMHALYWPHRAELGVSEIERPRPAPRLAANFIRTQPRQVYVDGFETDRPQGDHRRFGGSAVNFLPLARFD